MTLVGEHEANKENLQPAIGEVLLLKQEQVFDSEGRPFFRRTVRVGDESDANIERRLESEEIGEQLNQWLIDHPIPEGEDVEDTLRTVVGINPETKEKFVYVPDENKAGRWLYYDENNQPTQMLDWAKDFPTAIALFAIQRPSKEGGRRLPQGELDERTIELFTYMVDAIGIRSRARIYAQRLVELAQSTDGPLNIISVGSGAAVPNIDASLRIEKELGQYVKWKFFDIDPNALEFAHELVQEVDLEKTSFDYGPVSYDVDENKWKFKGRSFSRAYKEESESADVVDALGLWEYLKKDTAVKFAKELYDKVKPGGMMIVSNMLKGRPQEEFNIRGVGWPNLELRSEEDLLEIMEEAGINTMNVTMTHSEDGVYVVMEIQKP